MSLNKNSIRGPVIRSIIVILAMFAAIILGFAYMFYDANKNEYETNLAVNVLGKQRMLSQMIGKDANRLYTLIQSRESGYALETGHSIEDEIKAVKENLTYAGEEFGKTLAAVRLGYVESNGEQVHLKKSIQEVEAQLQEVDRVWPKFKDSVRMMLDTSNIDLEVADALAYIDSNNETLLRAFDAIIQAVVNQSKASAKNNRSFYMALLILALVIVAIVLNKLYKHIINPFKELFDGISKIGLDNKLNTSSMPTKKEMAPVVSEIGGMFKKIEILISLIENMNKNSSFNEFLKFIYEAFSEFIPYSYIGIALVKDNGRMLEASYGISDGSIKGLPQGLMGEKYYLRDTSLGRIVDSGNARIINDLEQHTSGKPLKDYNRLILNAGIRSSITLPLKVNTSPVGIIFFSSRHKNVYTIEHIKFLETLANSIAISLEKNIFTDELLYGSILAMVKLAEAKDEETGDHLDRMKMYSRVIAQLLSVESKYSGVITPEYIENIERFSPMHDIGKVGISDGILLKPGKLTGEEFEEMKKHASYGADVLRTAESNITSKGRNIFQMGVEIAEGHHEKWDGSGYPHGKKGEDIPLSARIVAVADVFDALTSKRPYKEKFSFEQSFEMILQGSGKHFDPEIVRTFEKNKRIIYEVHKGFQVKIPEKVS